MRQAWHKLDLSRITFNFFRFESWPIMTWIIRVSLSTTLEICKAYFKSHQVWKQRLRTHILYEKLLRLYILGFCNQVLPNLRYLWSEEFCNQQQSIKLLKLVTYWDMCKGVSYRLEICETKEKSLLQNQLKLGIRVKVQLYIGILG